MLFGLGAGADLPVTLLLLTAGIAALWFDTAGEMFGGAWAARVFAAGMCLYRLRGLGPGRSGGIGPCWR